MKFRERMARFMAGRYGNDEFNRFLLGAELVLFILALFFRGTVRSILYTLVLVLIVYIYFRMLSKDIYKRQIENTRYQRVRYKVFGELKGFKERFVQRKDYKFFRCPSCKAWLRVPRGKGKIKIVCRKCGNSFMGKS